LPGVSSLADLLAPMTVAEFNAEYRGRKPLHIRGAADRFAPVMSWDILTSILNQQALWSPETLMLIMDTANVPSREYFRPRPGRSGGKGIVVDLPRVRQWMRRGASLILNGIETAAPGLRALTTVLAAETGGEIVTNLYCSWRAHPAFASHFDPHDVYALHIAGEKRWRVYQRHFEAPIDHPAFNNLNQAFHDKHKGSVTLTADMRPGDVLYIPCGFYHDALATGPNSLHLSTAVISIPGLELITALWERAVMDSAFRHGLPNPNEVGAAAFDSHIESLVRRLGELAREPSFRQRFREAMAAPRGGHAELKLPEDGAA
jgi:ribosomal protein L16 Arg81 hydroxylase